MDVKLTHYLHNIQTMHLSTTNHGSVFTYSKLILIYRELFCMLARLTGEIYATSKTI